MDEFLCCIVVKYSDLAITKVAWRYYVSPLCHEPTLLLQRTKKFGTSSLLEQLPSLQQLLFRLLCCQVLMSNYFLGKEKRERQLQIFEICSLFILCSQLEQLGIIS